jgi:hypothetical protein
MEEAHTAMAIIGICSTDATETVLFVTINAVEFQLRARREVGDTGGMILQSSM